MKYVLTLELQSDRIEGEFGIHRQLSDGNLHIYVHQGLNCLPLEQVTPFSSLEIEKLTKHEKKECCAINLTEEETNSLNTCVETSSNIT